MLVDNEQIGDKELSQELNIIYSTPIFQRQLDIQNSEVPSYINSYLRYWATHSRPRAECSPGSPNTWSIGLQIVRRGLRTPMNTYSTGSKPLGSPRRCIRWKYRSRIRGRRSQFNSHRCCQLSDKHGMSNVWTYGWIRD